MLADIFVIDSTIFLCLSLSSKQTVNSEGLIDLNSAMLLRLVSIELSRSIIFSG